MKGSRTLCTLAGHVTTTTAFSPDDQSGVTRDGRPLLKYLRLDSNQHCRGSEPRASYQLGYVGKIESPIVTHRRGCVCARYPPGQWAAYIEGRTPASLLTHGCVHRGPAHLREASLNGPASLRRGTCACVHTRGFEPPLDGISGRCLYHWATYAKYLWPDSNRHSADFEAARFAVSAHRHEPPPAIWRGSKFVLTLCGVLK